MKKIKSFIGSGFLITTVVITLIIFYSCNKNNDLVTNNNNQQNQTKENSVPFFNVAKGDSISKDIYREKPDFTGQEETTILFNTENHLKATGYSSGNAPIYGLYASIRSHNNVGNSLTVDGVKYYKIPVDLNEGAGGKWIYLFYTKEIIKNQWGYPISPINYIGTFWRNHSVGQDGSVVPKYNGAAADLNDGAGGKYVYIGFLRSNTNPIKNILIASSNSSNVSFSGWQKCPDDLNKGAGGKYIYIFYKR